jgi:hypothetical protein
LIISRTVSLTFNPPFHNAGFIKTIAGKKQNIKGVREHRSETSTDLLIMIQSEPAHIQTGSSGSSGAPRTLS